MYPREMNKKEEQKLEEFEKYLKNNNYLSIVLVSVLIIGAGLACSWAVFSMISNAINNYFGG